MSKLVEAPEKRFILWDRKDGEFPRRSDVEVDEHMANLIISEGVLGWITEDNVYLTTYANYPGVERPRDLAVGCRISNVQYSLSGSKGVYDLYRVR
jgi:hypothetical protein